jgi:hypothetical protein
MANLSGTGGPLAAGNVYLIASGPNATVSDDGVVSRLQDDSGMNLYFAKRTGTV